MNEQKRTVQLEFQLAQMSSKVADLNLHLQEAQRALAKEASENISARRQLDIAQRDLENMASVVDARDVLREEIGVLHGRLKLSNDGCLSAIIERDEARRRLETSKNDYNIVVAAGAEISIERDAVKRELKKLQQQFEDVKLERDVISQRAAECEAKIASLTRDRNGFTDLLKSEHDASRRQLEEVCAEVQKAIVAMGNGTDDARWKPGETAVDALIRENDAVKQELAKLQTKMEMLLGMRDGQLHNAKQQLNEIREAFRFVEEAWSDEMLGAAIAGMRKVINNIKTPSNTSKCESCNGTGKIPGSAIDPGGFDWCECTRPTSNQPPLVNFSLAEGEEPEPDTDPFTDLDNNNNIKPIWLPCDQTVQCAICGWVDWDETEHTQECPISRYESKVEVADEAIRAALDFIKTEPKRSEEILNAFLYSQVHQDLNLSKDRSKLIKNAINTDDGNIAAGSTDRFDPENYDDNRNVMLKTYGREIAAAHKYISSMSIPEYENLTLADRIKRLVHILDPDKNLAKAEGLLKEAHKLNMSKDLSSRIDSFLRRDSMCYSCRRPVANEEDARTMAQDEGQHLCWHKTGFCQGDNSRPVNHSPEALEFFENKLNEEDNAPSVWVVEYKCFHGWCPFPVRDAVWLVENEALLGMELIKKTYPTFEFRISPYCFKEK